MKSFIGRYFKTPEKAVKHWEGLSEELRECQSVCELGDSYFVLGNKQIEKFNQKRK